MDDIWVILGSIVLMVLSSFSSAKKKKGNASSVDTDPDVAETISDEEVAVPIEDVFYGQRQEKNKEEEERFETVCDFVKENGVETVEEREEEPENDMGDFAEGGVDFDLRKAVIYSTILENPYTTTEKINR